MRALSPPLRSARCAPSLRALLRACPPPLFTRIAPSLHVLPSSLDVGLRVLSPSPHALPPLSTRRSPSLRKLRAALRVALRVALRGSGALRGAGATLELVTVLTVIFGGVNTF